MTEMEVEDKLDAKMVTPRIPIEDIIIGDRFRKDLGGIETLSKSIKSVGLLHPIVVSKNLELIAGRRRIEACKKLGWKKIPVHIVSLEDLKRGEYEENAKRKNFTASEMAAIDDFYGPEAKAEAKKRQISTLKKGVKAPVRENFPNGDKGRTRDFVANFVGVSGRTLEKVKKIVAAAKADPENFGDILEDVDSGKTSISHAHTKINRRRKHIVPPSLPEGIFDVVLVDPPWQYYFPLRGAPDAHYPTMKKEDILELELPVADDSILFLWSTNPHLENALDIVREWGFTYKTNLVWVKDKIGTGYYVRGKHELLLIATKGKIPPPIEENRFPSVLYAPRKEHSTKPDEVYNYIEVMYPNRRYLELFARNPRENWTSWGLEI